MISKIVVTRDVFWNVMEKAGKNRKFKLVAEAGHYDAGIRLKENDSSCPITYTTKVLTNGNYTDDKAMRASQKIGMNPAFAENLISASDGVQADGAQLKPYQNRLRRKMLKLLKLPLTK